MRTSSIKQQLAEFIAVEKARPPQGKWVLYLGIFAIVSFIIATVIRVLTPQVVEVPQTQFVQTNLNNTTSSFANITFNGERPTFPRSLPVATSTPAELSLETIINNFITTYDLKPHSKLNNFWTSETTSLNIDPFSNKVIFDTDSTIQGNTVNKNQAVTEATKQIQALFPTLKVEPIESEISYHLADVHFTHTTEDKAQVIKIPFSYQLGGYPVFYQNERDFLFKPYINSDYKIMKLEFFPSFRNFQELGTRNLISVNDALKNIIEKEEGAMISGYQSELGTLDWRNITSGTFSKVSLEFRTDPQSNLTFPFYRFSGELRNDQGQLIFSEVITPAIELKDVPLPAQ